MCRLMHWLTTWLFAWLSSVSTGGALQRICKKLGRIPGRQRETFSSNKLILTALTMLTVLCYCKHCLTWRIEPSGSSARYPEYTQALENHLHECRLRAWLTLLSPDSALGEWHPSRPLSGVWGRVDRLEPRIPAGSG